VTTEPKREVEVERTYDVDQSVSLPDFSGLAVASPVEVRMLDAHYFDTADAVLARAGIALRHRTGGPDAGWHIKGPRVGDARVEVTWPLSSIDEVPDAAVEALAQWGKPPFTPLARIQNARHAYTLSDANGAIAEFVDDHVQALDSRASVERAWREWELELSPAVAADEARGEALFAALEKAIFATGAVRAASASKLARALGH
jgi:hypothetical protein